MCEKNIELIVFSVKMHVIFRQLFVYRKRPLVQWSVWYCQDWSNYDHGTWNQGWGQQVWYGGKLIIGIERSFKNSKKSAIFLRNHFLFQNQRFFEHFLLTGLEFESTNWHCFFSKKKVDFWFWFLRKKYSTIFFHFLEHWEYSNNYNM